MEGCWQCTGFETCSLLEPMTACHGSTVKHNLRMIRQFGVENWAHRRGKHYVWTEPQEPRPVRNDRRGSDREQYKVDFESIPWESPAPGLRFKAYKRDGRSLRLAEFTREFVEPDWCIKGHAGYVLAGEIEVDFRGKKVVLRAGDGLFIPPGSKHGHKARAITDSVTLVLVDE
jgi:hypothetical protein